MLTFTQRLESIHFDMDKIPKEFIDPVSLDIMENPVSLSDGHIYDQSTAAELIAHRNPKSPMTREVLERWHTKTIHVLRSQIVSFVEAQEASARPFMGLLNAKDALLRSKDALLQAKDALLQAKDALLQEKEDEIHEKDNEINQLKRERDETYQTLEDTLTKNGERIRELEEQLSAHQNKGWGILSFFNFTGTPAPSNELENDKNIESKSKKFKL